MFSTFEHLLTCLRQLPEDEKLALLQKIPAPDWNKILQLAKPHGLTPNLYHALKPYKEKLEISEDVFSELRRLYFHSAARNMRFFGELERLLHCFNREKIPVALLKGAHLAEAVYGNIALRSMIDIDLLVRESDLEKADTLLLAQGAQPHAKQRIKSAKGKHFSYTLPAKKIFLELHWDPINGEGNGISATMLWSRLDCLGLGSEKALALKPIDLIPYLCLHLAEHLHELCLRMLYDLDVIIRFYGDKLDWRQIVATAREWNGEAATYVFLAISADFFKTPVPRNVLDMLTPENIDTADLDRIAGLFKNDFEETGDSLPTPGVSLWWETKGIRKKAALVFKRLIPPPGTLSATYGAPPGSWRRFAYYPLYLRDLCRWRIAALLSLILGRRETRNSARQISETETMRRKLLHRA
ncbi:MAG: nucleotidyltransferase family protein [Lentisphaeria bacterium]|nr:nucleotidyltransferase family protein [Lentisphaeria bacterium]